jgi:uncharacterized protein
MYRRRISKSFVAAIQRFPVVGLLGPRQVGKTTFARSLPEPPGKKIVYLDLERDSDRRKLDDAESYLSNLSGALVVLDEIQRMPEIFPLLRSLVDERIHRGEQTGQFVVLGSASRDLLRQSSESLAGRITYLDLAAFTLGEFEPSTCDRAFIERMWIRGGYPASFLAADDATSWEWRRSFIETYLERDIPQLGPRLPAERLRRFWSMLAHGQAEPWNGAKIASGLEVSGHTARHYLDVLADLGMVRLLKPWAGNSRKRLVRTPKAYVRDSGLVHRMTNVPDLDTLLGHPICGHSWEGFAVEQLLTFASPDFEATYFRTAAGHEIDLVLEGPRSRVLAIEIKRTRTPTVAPGFLVGCEEIGAAERWIVVPDGETYSVGSDTRVIGLRDLVEKIATVGAT